MNVLLVGKFYVEDFALHIAETLSDMGHAVVRFEGPPLSATGTGLGYRISQVRQLISQVQTFRPCEHRDCGRLAPFDAATDGAPAVAHQLASDQYWSRGQAELHDEIARQVRSTSPGFSRQSRRRAASSSPAPAEAVSVGFTYHNLVCATISSGALGLVRAYDVGLRQKLLSNYIDPGLALLMHVTASVPAI